MKVWLMTAYSCAVLLTTPAFADDADVLQNRLKKVNSFYASFTQQVTGSEGWAIQEGTGELWVKRPNLFNWHMISPDKSLLISDGKTLLFYNPFLEQATAYWLKNAISNTPFMLITRNRTNNWHQYKVKRQGDNFSLVSKLDNDNMKKMTIKVTENGTIKSFSLVEKDGQCSAYQLQSQKNVQVGNAKFYFTLPEGVTLDDQRQ